MVRPNGSVIGRDSVAKGLGEGPVIQMCLFGGQPRQGETAPPSQSRHVAMPLQSATCSGAVQAISGRAPASGPGTAIPRERLPCPWAALAFSALAACERALAAAPLASAPRLPDWDPAWSTRAS